MNNEAFNKSALALCLGLACGFNVPASTASELSVMALDAKSIEQEDIQIMRDQWAQLFIGNPDLPITDNFLNATSLINDWAHAFTTTATLSKDGIWPDLPLRMETEAEQEALAENLHATYHRLFIIAQAYKLEGGNFEGDHQTLVNLTKVLTLLNKEHFNETTTTHGSEWHWRSGIARTVNNTLAILFDELPKGLIDKYVTASKYLISTPNQIIEGPNAPYTSVQQVWKSTKGNQLDIIQVVLVRGILSNNVNDIEAALSAFSDVIQTTNKGDGFYNDGSFIQNEDIPYNGTYGQDALESLGLIVNVTKGTTFQPKDEELSKIYSQVSASYLPLMRDGKVMDMVNGRAISQLYEQNDFAGLRLISSLLLFVDSAPEHIKGEFNRKVFTQLTHAGGISHSQLMGLSQLSDAMLEGEPYETYIQNSHHQYTSMSRTVHHRPTWSFGIATHSEDVGNYECVNGENFKGWHTADGMTYLYNQQSQYNSGFWATVNPNKLPGTTSIIGSHEDCEGQRNAKNSSRNDSINWSGGSYVGNDGVVGFNFHNWNDSLKANKSWFMFDDEVIALGSGIDNKMDLPGITTFANRSVKADATVLIDGKPLTRKGFDGPFKVMTVQYKGNKAPIGYLNLSDATGQIDKKCRLQSWDYVGTSTGYAENCFIEGTFAHSETKTRYAYAIIPEHSPAYTLNATFLNTKDVHAVWKEDQGIYAANFFDESKAGIVEALDPLSIFMKEDKEIVTVSISDPTNSWFNREFILDGQYAVESDTEARIEIKDGNRFTVKTSDLNRASYSFTLRKL